MSQWGFLQLWSPWLWLILVLFIGLVIYCEKKIRLINTETTQSTSVLPRSRIVIPILISCLIAAALTQPFWGKETISISSSGGSDIFIVLDVSISMLAQDASPSRIKFAQRKARDIVAGLMSAGQEARIGIILFAGDAYVFCPLTSDSSVITQFLQNIDAELVTARGSSLARALEVTKQAINDAQSTQARVVILSDGEDLKNSAKNLINIVESFPATILFLGIGSEQGAPIPLPQGGYLSANQQVVTTKMNADELAEVFSRNNSRFKKVTLFDSDFQELLAPQQLLKDSASNTAIQNITSYGELGPVILILALGLVLINSWRTGVIFILVLGTTFQATNLHAEPNPLNDSPAYEGFRAYQEGDFSKSFEDFSKALSADPKNSRLLNSLASAAFKEGKFTESEALFSEAGKYAQFPSTQFDAHYGAGNAALAQKKYRQAIDAYTEALRISPNDERALHNNRIAEQLIKEDEKKQEQKQEQDPEQKKDKESEKKERKSEQPKPEEKPQKDPSEQSTGQPTPASDEQEKNDDTDPSKSSDQENSEGQKEGPESPKEEITNQSDSPSSSPQENQKKGTSTTQSESDSRPLSEKQAKEWLESLPDTPLLLQRLNKRERINPGDQFW